MPHAMVILFFFVTFVSLTDVVRGSHVTTVDGDRFCGAADNVGGFGNVLVTGRQTHANIFFFYFVQFIFQSILISVNDFIRLNSIQYSVSVFGFLFFVRRINQSFTVDANCNFSWFIISNDVQFSYITSKYYTQKLYSH